MNIKYDKKIDALYIELAVGEYNDSRKINEDIVVDADKKGKVLGIEILNAKKVVPSFNPDNFDFKLKTI